MSTRKNTWAGVGVALALHGAACGGAGNGAPAAATTTATSAGAEQATADLPGFRQPRAGLWTGGRPTQADLQAASALGVGVVISLLPAAELGDEAAQVSALHMAFASIPIAGEADLTEANARALGEVLTAHRETPVLLHCASGNRVGALLALHAYYVEGMSAADAITLGVNAGLTSLQPAVRTHLDAACAATPERC